jgi:hypothetical protein
MDFVPGYWMDEIEQIERIEAVVGFAMRSGHDQPDVWYGYWGAS